MYSKTSGSCSGSPHSSHSVTVSGSEGSRIEVSASTNGTCATMPPKSRGAMFATAPISSPPADPPRAISRDGRVQGRYQVLGAGDEVGEGVALAQHLAVVIPAAAELAAAADVRDRVHEAAVQQREPGNREARVPGDLVTAVPVEQQRRAAVARGALRAHQRDRYFRPVGGRRPL